MIGYGTLLSMVENSLIVLAASPFLIFDPGQQDKDTVVIHPFSSDPRMEILWACSILFISLTIAMMLAIERFKRRICTLPRMKLRRRFMLGSAIECFVLFWSIAGICFIGYKQWVSTLGQERSQLIYWCNDLLATSIDYNTRFKQSYPENLGVDTSGTPIQKLSDVYSLLAYESGSECAVRFDEERIVDWKNGLPEQLIIEVRTSPHETKKISLSKGMLKTYIGGCRDNVDVRYDRNLLDSKVYRLLFKHSKP
jgi:hypothetical protein